VSLFLLIRHGESQAIAKGFVSGHMPGILLTPEGERQSERLAANLANTSIHAIYASPLERTLQTAAPLAKKLGLTVIPDVNFIEFDVGDWAGLTFPELEQIPAWQAFHRLRSFTRADDHGETMLEVQHRALFGIERLRKLHPGQTVAIFSHGDTIRAIIQYALGIPLDFFERFLVSPASISTLELTDEGGPRVLGLNVPAA
jgi:broad specificity phosphatase PhoE